MSLHAPIGESGGPTGPLKENEVFSPLVITLTPSEIVAVPPVPPDPGTDKVSEWNINILSVTASREDEDVTVTIDFSDPAVDNQDDATVTIEGLFSGAFPQSISYTESQVKRNPDGTPELDSDGNLQFDETLALVQHTTGSWDSMPPDPGRKDFRIEDFWYLYQFTPPSVTTRTITYTVQYEFEDRSTGSPVIVQGTYVNTTEVTVEYDLDANLLNFDRYTSTEPYGLPVTLPYTILR